MTNRVQTLRSSMPGARPSSRAPGELFVNFPDRQLGVVDSASAPLDLIAVRFFSAGANYAVGDCVMQGGKVYQATAAIAPGAFNPAQWTALSTAADLASANTQIRTDFAAADTATLNAAESYADAHDTTTLNSAKSYADAGDATTLGSAKSYVDALPVAMNDNRIINGDMMRDQRNNGAIVTPVNGDYVIDRWRCGAALTGKITTARDVAAAPGLVVGVGYQFTINTAAAYTAAATEAFQIYQPIEANLITDFAFGTNGAQPVTLSFWVWSKTLTGTFSGSLCNAAGTRSYPFVFQVPTAATWTKVIVTIPGDTAGAWVLQSNAAGVLLRFDLGSGANFRGPAGAWASVNYVGAAGSVSPVAVAGQTTVFSNVKLEIGSVATPFNRQSPAKFLADCQRYYQTFPYSMYTFSPATGVYGNFFNFPPMRATPTATVVSPAYGNASAATAATMSIQTGTTTITQTAAGYAWANWTMTLSAEL
jgi:hypothetical protein